MADDKNQPAPRKTTLYDVHLRHGGKMVVFAGHMMPVQYRGILDEHLKVRHSVGIFDVSHMGEFEIRGSGALDFLQHMTINDVSRLQAGQAQYSAICNENGGIIDDLIVYRFDDHYLLVVNAANTETDFRWLQQHLAPQVELANISEETSLLAVQGRNAQATLQKLTRLNLGEVKYYWFASGEIAGVSAMIARTGYTGEDGFEVMMPAPHAVAMWEAILDAGKEFDIEPIGLGARDTLRLEVKYCLHGNDIDPSTNPIEAGLGWITKLDKGDFIGKTAIAKVKSDGPSRKLVGFEVESKQIARHGYPILKDNKSIGQVTSGTFSPCLKKSIGLGYVAIEYSSVDTEIAIDMRGRPVSARIIKTPFYRRPY